MATVTAEILDGSRTAKAIKAELVERVTKLREQGVVPGLATVLVGDDPGSRWYVNGKHKDCAEVGIESIRGDLPVDVEQRRVEAAIADLNANRHCTGYIVQLPLPRHMDENEVLGQIDPTKDADGLHPTNLGWLVLGEPAPLPCTPYGILELLSPHGVGIDRDDVEVVGPLRRLRVGLPGAEVGVVGRGLRVGRRLGVLLTRRSENSTVTLCHTG